jgi:pyruvate kinase
MHKRTKIIATIGPASKSLEVIHKLYKNGMNVVRVNMSHASIQDLNDISQIVSKLNKKLKSSIGLMIDTQGPEIRTSNFKGSISLIKGDVVTLCSTIKNKNAKEIRVDNLSYVKGLKVGGKISLDNGQIDLKIKKIAKERIDCSVLDAGIIAGKKHVNFPGATVKLPTLTSKDKRDIKEGLKCGVDFIALSFARTDKDLKELTSLLKRAKNKPEIFAKIEEQQGMDNIDEITKHSDGLLVARGDLGIETDITNLPYVQRKMVRVALQAGKKCIVATQLLESMITNPHPTRAEVSDVANAVYEGVDALMLSAETTVGKFPVKCVKYLSDIAKNAERSETLHFENNIKHMSDWHTLASTSVKLAKRINADAIVVLTRSGFTANLISSARPRVPVYAFTNDKTTQNKLSMASSLENIYLNFKRDHEKTIGDAFNILKNDFKLRGKKKFIVISGVFSDEYADAIQIRFLK